MFSVKFPLLLILFIAFLGSLVQNQLVLEYIVATSRGEERVYVSLNDNIVLNPFGLKIPVLLSEAVKGAFIDIIDFSLTLKVGEEPVHMVFKAIRILEARGDLTLEAYYDNETKILLYAAVVSAQGEEAEVRLYRLPYYPIALTNKVEDAWRSITVDLNPYCRRNSLHEGYSVTEIVVIVKSLILIVLITLKIFNLF